MQSGEGLAFPPSGHGARATTDDAARAPAAAVTFHPEEAEVRARRAREADAAAAAGVKDGGCTDSAKVARLHAPSEDKA